MRCNTAIGFGFGRRLHVVTVSAAVRPVFIDVQWKSYDADTGAPLDGRTTDTGKLGLVLLVLVLLTAVSFTLVTSHRRSFSP